MLSKKEILRKVKVLLPASVQKTVLVKIMFLIKQEFNPRKFYSFFPYKYGPYSYELERNLQTLNISSEKNQKMIESSNGFVFKNFVLSIYKKYNTAGKIKTFVYSRFPEFKPKKPKKSKDIYTIGYQGKSIDYFLNELIQNNINLLVDVRANPFSMKPDFIASKLKKYLKRSNIEYLNIKELGIPSSKRKNIKTKKQLQKLLTEYYNSLSNHEKQLKELIRISRNQRIALMCFESNPIECHRSRISNYINHVYGVKVTNI